MDPRSWLPGTGDPITRSSGDLVVDDLAVSHGPVRALHGISLRVPEGGAVAVLGANGAGKTTLMRTISGLMRPGRSGRLTYAGRDLTRLRPDEIVRLGIAHVPEGRQVFVRQTVLENLQLGRLTRRDSAEAEEELERLLAVFPDLRTKLKVQAGFLSGGQQQMLAIARGMMSLPSLLLLDEPSLGLAPILMDEITEHLARLREERKVGILLVDQNAVMATELTDRTYVLRRGRIVSELASAEIRGNRELIGAYLGGGPT